MIIKNVKDVLFVSTAISIVSLGVASFFLSTSSVSVEKLIASGTVTATRTGSSAWVAKETNIITAQASNLSPDAVKAGLTAYQKAREKGLDQKGLLTIIDFTKPSADRRMLVFDLNQQKVLFNTWVAHGKNSGEANATSFSNDARSLKSSLGVFVTSDIYDGKHGESLRVQGLEPGINDNALKRDIVIHSAQYVGADVAKSRGKLGRSWGCMAVSPKTIQPLINTIKGNTLVVAYYPDKKWLAHSAYL
jgi:hypothetical protein